MATRKKASEPTRDPAAALKRWADVYRAAAWKDRYRQLAERLEEVGLDARWAPEVVENTVGRVALVAKYYAIDGRADFDEFLRLQTYDVTLGGARYLLRLEPAETVFLLVIDMNQVDLVDLFNSPPGFIHLYIDHVDGTPFKRKELNDLAKAIRDDFYFDFEPDEITLEVETSKGGIAVNVCEADKTPPWL